MNKNYFFAAVIFLFSLSIISDMDFENLSGLDLAVIVSTLIMILVNVAAYLRNKNA